jgi:transcriptional regulator with GAF, ATPase, and Fis domain
MATQNRLLDGIYERIGLLQKLTNIIAECSEKDQCCKLVVHQLVEEFHFGSSQLWLLDSDSNYLYCNSSLGYPSNVQKMIMNQKFKYREDWDNPHGLLSQTMESRKTIIVNDIQDILPRVSAKTREFLIALKLSSFIMTPLIRGEKVLGVLAAEFHFNEKIDNQEKLVFQFISEVLTNAILKMEADEK